MHLRFVPRAFLLSVLLASLEVLGGCHYSATGVGNLFPTALPLPAETRQMLVVREGRFPAPPPARVHAWERHDGMWRPALTPMAAVIGKNGFAPPGGKREGDGRTPSGLFPLEMVFGYDAATPTRMPYRQAGEEDLWVDDPASPDYNRWVRKGETRATSFEELRRQDDLYRYGIVIGYNTDPVIPGVGSAIFLHIWQGPASTTAGCVALAEADLLKILTWLQPEYSPVIVLGTAHP